MAEFDRAAKGGTLEQFPCGPPLLDRGRVKVEGLAFIGLSLSRNHSADDDAASTFSHHGSITRQSKFDFNEIQDREYKYFIATNDDGWLCGGGENGESYKLPNPDSAHCEIVRVGTFNEEWGGISRDRIRQAMSEILVPHVEVTPSFVLRNGDAPPELELKFELERTDGPVETWPNWQLRFIHNQLFDKLQCPARFCPGPHHMTFVRKAGFRSAEHMRQYFAHCHEVVKRWRKTGPTALEPERNPLSPGYPRDPLGEELKFPHGVYLFKTRNEPVEYFAPNFHPPYDTPEKRKIIADVLGKEWHSPTLSWKEAPCEPSALTLSVASPRGGA